MGTTMILALLLATSIATAPRPAHATHPAPLSAADKAFVMKAAMGNNYELKAAAMAARMSTDPSVKAFAAMMTKDHTALGAQMKAAVAKNDASMQMPMGVDAKNQKRLDDLQKAGAKFNSEYRSQMIESHSEVHDLFADYIKDKDSNSDIKSVVAGAQPTVMGHWNGAKALPEK